MVSTKLQNLLAFLFISCSIIQSTVCTRPDPPTTNTQDLISTTCNQTLYVDVCISSLRSDPKSHTADLKGLLAISLNLTLAHANQTIKQLEEDVDVDVQDDADDAYLEACLEDCLDEYSDAIGILLLSVDALGQGSYDLVNDLVSAAMTNSVTCEDGFAELPGYVSPLAERNEYFSKLCSISLAMTNLLAS